MTEAAAIGAYLADAFPAAGLAPPPGDRRRAPSLLPLMFFAAGPLEAVTNKALGFVVPEGRASTAGYGALADVLNAVEGLVSKQDYVTGDVFSAADVYLGAQIGSGSRFGISRSVPLSSDTGRVSPRGRPPCAPMRSTTA